MAVSPQSRYTTSISRARASEKSSRTSGPSSISLRLWGNSVSTSSRISDINRERVPEAELAQTRSRPNPSTTRYRLIESLVIDLGIYFNAYLVKSRLRQTASDRAHSGIQ